MNVFPGIGWKPFTYNYKSNFIEYQPEWVSETITIPAQPRIKYWRANKVKSFRCSS